MKLSNTGLQDTAWKEKGYQLPEYDRELMKEKTLESPRWIHFGPGNLFKAFQARAMDTLLENGDAAQGILVVERRKSPASEAAKAYDQLVILATLYQNGAVEKSVVGSIADSLVMDPAIKDDYDRLISVFEYPDLQMASFTITEKGYDVFNADGTLKEEVASDIQNKPEDAKTYLGRVAALLYKRWLAGSAPFALVSMDNCSHNGDKLKEAILTYGKGWKNQGLAEAEFVSWLENDMRYPWSMIDKITPAPHPMVAKLLEEDEVELATGTSDVPFVNAEPTQYLVIEDNFPNGRPRLEKAGIIFTDQKTVDLAETMKVTTCLNPLHTALAVFGCLLDYKTIWQEMEDPDLKALVKRIGYKEGLPVVEHPGILDPEEFLSRVIEARLPNSYLPDSPARIATDTSLKLAVRYGKTVKAYLADDNLSVDDLKGIPMVVAGWLRYLLGVNDQGEPMELSSDPLLDDVLPVMENIHLGDQVTKEDLMPIFKDNRIFDVDMDGTGLADTITEMFNRLNKGPGAVRLTLHELALEK